MLDWTNYEKPMKDYLSKFMNQHKSLSYVQQKAFTELFSQTCTTIVDKLGERPFHIRRGLNIAVFDSVAVNVANHIGAVPDDLKRNYMELTKDNGFLTAVTSSTTNEDVVKSRFGFAASMLFGSNAS